MGNAKSRQQNESLASSTHFSLDQIKAIKTEFEKINKNDEITKDQFMETIEPFVRFATTGEYFLERLFDAFDVDHNGRIEFSEFINGLSSFVKGTSEEKLLLSFKIFDLDHDGSITRTELKRMLTLFYSTLYGEDCSSTIDEVVARIFDDLDVNGDGELDYEEYRLSALKEPMVTDFLDQFLNEDPANNGDDGVDGYME